MARQPRRQRQLPRLTLLLCLLALSSGALAQGEVAAACAAAVPSAAAAAASLANSALSRQATLWLMLAPSCLSWACVPPPHCLSPCCSDSQRYCGHPSAGSIGRQPAAFAAGRLGSDAEGLPAGVQCGDPGQVHRPLHQVSKQVVGVMLLDKQASKQGGRVVP